MAQAVQHSSRGELVAPRQDVQRRQAGTMILAELVQSCFNHTKACPVTLAAADACVGCAAGACTPRSHVWACWRTARPRCRLRCMSCCSSWQWRWVVRDGDSCLLHLLHQCIGLLHQCIGPSSTFDRW